MDIKLCIVVTLLIALVVAGLLYYTMRKEKFSLSKDMIDLGSSLMDKKRAEIKAHFDSKNRDHLSISIAQYNALVSALGLRVAYPDSNEAGIWTFDSIHGKWDLYVLRTDGKRYPEFNQENGLTYKSNYGMEVYEPLGSLKGIWIQDISNEPYTWIYFTVVDTKMFYVEIPPESEMTNFCYWDLVKRGNQYVPAMFRLCLHHASPMVWHAKGENKAGMWMDV